MELVVGYLSVVGVCRTSSDCNSGVLLDAGQEKVTVGPVGNWARDPGSPVLDFEQGYLGASGARIAMKGGKDNGKKDNNEDSSLISNTGSERIM